MSTLRFQGSATAIIAGLMFLTLASPRAARAQDQNGANDVTVTMSAADKSAAAQVTNRFRTATPAFTQRAKASRAEGLLTLHPSFHRQSAAASAGQNALRYPADLTYLGGALVDYAQSHPVYLLPNGHCPVAQCWGHPAEFIEDISKSDFIHLVDQYIGLNASRRYTLGSAAKLSYTPPTVPLTDNDILAVVHAVASVTGNSGYGHIFHVFLAPGQDECFDSTFSVCYSPDNNNSFVFCAYHGSVDFSDIGHVLYSVEPFQNVPGCQVRPGTPNGQLVDSTNSTLSHETIETITDPDGDAWWNYTDNVLFGEEIADECAFVVFTPTNAYGDPSVYRIGEKLYATQPEYSNELHACSVH